jgi:hypothetical protein
MQYLPPWVLIDLIEERRRDLEKAARRTRSRTSPLNRLLHALRGRPQQRPEAAPGGIPACHPHT